MFSEIYQFLLADKIQKKICINARIFELQGIIHLIIYDINFSLLQVHDLEINDLDRQTDGQQSDPAKVPFLPLEVQNPKITLAN